MYSFGQLRGFVAVAEELHFGRASEKLCMTQPSLSRQIQKLELDLGVQLIERSARHISLTPAGASFLAEARRLLSVAERARDSVRRVAGGEAGFLAMSFTAMASITLLPALLVDARSLLPGVSITLSEMVSADQTDRVLLGEVDLGLVRVPRQSEHLNTRRVQQEHLVAAVPASHPLGANTSPLSVRAFDGLDLIEYDSARAGYFAAHVTRALAGVSPRSRQHLTQVHSVLALVGSGLGVAIVPESAQVLNVRNVVTRPLLEYPMPVVELHALWRTDNTNAALACALETLPALHPVGGSDTFGVSPDTQKDLDSHAPGTLH